MTKTKDIVKAIHFSDTHFMPSNYMSLYTELKDGLYNFIELNGDDYDVLFFEGDYFHEKLQLNDDVTKTAIKFVYELIQLCNQKDIKIRFIRGTKSHDFDQLENFRSYEKDYDFKIYNTVDTEELFPEFYVLYLPEEYMDSQETYYKDFFDLDEDVKYDMIVFHGTFDFTAFESQKQESERNISNSAVFDSNQMLELAHGIIIGGHIHSPQKYKKRIVYNGSYSCNSFDETGEHGFTISTQTISTGEVIWERIVNKTAPRYITLEADDDFKGYTFEEKMRILDDIMDEGDFVRLQISATLFDTITELMMFKEKSNKIKKFKLVITDSNLIDIKKSKDNKKIEDIMEDGIEDTTYDFITKDNLDIFNTVKKFIEIKNATELDVETIQNIMVSATAK